MILSYCINLYEVMEKYMDIISFLNLLLLDKLYVKYCDNCVVFDVIID